jgi:hypothetical protein
VAWTNSVAITINHAKVPNTDQSNFPVLFTGTYAQLATVANGGAVTSSWGHDILFAADSAGASPLSFQRVAYRGGNGSIEAWIKIPTLSHTADTTLYILFGNSAITTDQQTPAAVWDSTFEGVWHLNSTAGVDSTGNANQSTSGSVTSATGKIALCASFDGATNFLQVPGSASLNGWTAQTVSFWVKSPGGMASFARAIEKGANNEWTIAWNLGGGTNKLSVQSLGGSSGLLTSTAALADSTWHKIDVTISSGNVVSLYVDGTLDQSATSGSSPGSKTGVLNFGQYGGGGNFYLGLMDEIQIANVVRSADWLATGYNNQSSPGTFYSTSLTSSSPTNPWAPVLTGPNVAAPITFGPWGPRHQIVKGPMSSAFAASYYTPAPYATPLKGGAVGAAYSEPISAQYGTTPYSFAVASGSIPAGTTLNGTTGVISGTPSAAGLFSFTITVTDLNTFTGSTPFSIGIAAAPSTAQRGNIDFDQIRATVRQGPGGKFQMFGGGTPVAGNLAVYDASGNVVDGGGTTNLPLRTSNVSTTLTSADYTVIATAPSITVTLPASPVAGKVFNIKNGNSTAGQLITVTGTGGVLIDTATSITLDALASVAVQWDGSQWREL